VFCGNGTASCNTSAYYNGPITKPGP
jgi:hypothetical protein